MWSAASVFKSLATVGSGTPVSWASWGAVRTGGAVRVRNPGGTLEVTLGDDERATTHLAGPVRKVADVDIHPGMLS